MSDEDLWWLFLNHREECSHEFWEEVENRKAAGTLSKDSPFWTMGAARYRHPRSSGDNSNLIKLTSEEWEASKTTPEDVPTDFGMNGGTSCTPE